jgi:hypothetical protein
VCRGGTNGKYIWSGGVFEEGIGKSTSGSPAVYSRTSGFGKLGIEWAADSVSLGSQKDQPRSKGEMVKGSKGIEASEDENNCVSTRETHHVGIRPEEDRGGAAEKVGEGEGGEEEGGIDRTDFAFLTIVNLQHWIEEHPAVFVAINPIHLLFLWLLTAGCKN